ncbi:hypothetical protein [Catellatospora coxensis]|nr:hypothetical protein [Catellatospora coxensis]
MRSLYRTLLESDPSVTSADVVHEEATDLPLPDLRRALIAKYEANPATQRIELRVAGASVGVTTRRRVCRKPGDAGVVGDTPAGEGDRATQPGDSTRYRTVDFRCSSCDQGASLSFYDERRMPKCPTAGHHVMELVREGAES